MLATLSPGLVAGAWGRGSVPGNVLELAGMGETAGSTGAVFVFSPGASLGRNLEFSAVVGVPSPPQPLNSPLAASATRTQHADTRHVEIDQRFAISAPLKPAGRHSPRDRERLRGRAEIPSAVNRILAQGGGNSSPKPVGPACPADLGLGRRLNVELQTKIPPGRPGPTQETQNPRPLVAGLVGRG